MEFKQLGNTAKQVSKICLGTMTFGEQNSEQEAHEQLDYAIERGINFIDTAELYAVPSNPKNNGKTEEFIGSWLGKRSDRANIVLGTKIVGPSAGLKHIRNAELNFSAVSIHTALEGSLQRLQTDYVDIYQLHWPERKTNCFGKLGYRYEANDPWKNNFPEIVETIGALIEGGKILHWGLSNETPWGVLEVIRQCERLGVDKPVSIQNPYSLLNRSYEVGMAEISIRETIGLLAYSPMAFGLLSGKYHRKEDNASSRLNAYKQMSRFNNANCWKATAEYLKIAEKYHLSLAQLSLAFVSDQQFTTSNIIGATNMTQLKENIDSASVSLPAEALAEIDAVHASISNPAP